MKPDRRCLDETCDGTITLDYVVGLQVPICSKCRRHPFRPVLVWTLDEFDQRRRLRMPMDMRVGGLAEQQKEAPRPDWMEITPNTCGGGP